MERFSYKSGCGMLHIEAFKRRASLDYTQAAFIVIKNRYTAKKLKNKPFGI